MSDMQCPATILVVRHGESEGNVAHRLTSAAPGELLTASGRAQAAALVERLRTRKIAHVYASPLLRAQQTGQIIAEALGVGLATLDGVGEFSMGNREGSGADEDWAHIDSTFLRWLDGDLSSTVDGGESGSQVVARMRHALQQLADLHRGETVVVVSHGGAMCLALPRCAYDVVADHARAHPVPNCGVVELDVGDSGWTLRQWPGDPDRAPHPGDLIDLVGRAAAQWVRVSADGSAVAAADIGAVPCASFDVDEPWATHATVTGVVDAPTPAHLREITDWLQATRPGSWQVRARAEQRDALVEQGLVPALELGVWVTDRRPRYTLPDGVEVGEAADVDEFVAVYGDELAPIVVGQLGRTGRDFLMLRERGRPVGCARVTEVSGTAYVSAITVLGEHRGRGLGRLISAAATARAVRQAGLAWLHCEDAMSVLYEQVGYRRLTSHVHLGPGELR